jgi:hypothetical protein
MTQSAANQSLKEIPCYDGKKQGISRFLHTIDASQRQKSPGLHCFPENSLEFRTAKFPNGSENSNSLIQIRSGKILAAFAAEWAGERHHFRADNIGQNRPGPTEGGLITVERGWLYAGLPPNFTRL